MSGERAAVFLDRDGTVIQEKEYLADPEGVRLVPGVPGAIRALRDAGYPVVITTNQSGIARGYYDEEAYRAVAARLGEILAGEGASVDGTYHCPHHPDFTGPCPCRKPGTGMFREAARDLGLDLSRSVYVGDRIKDVVPALVLGGTGFLVRTGYGAGEERHAPESIRVVDDVAGVAERILRGD